MSVLKKLKLGTEMKIELVGKTIGNWLIAERIGDGISKSRDKWSCICQCGAVKLFTENGLKKLHDRSSCGCARSSFIRIGDKFSSSIGTVATVKEKLSGGCSVLCIFEDGTEQVIGTGNLRRGAFKNPNLPTVAGIGFIGVGKYDSGSHPDIFSRWYSIFRRVYLETDKPRNSSYIGASTCEDWHNFQNFAEWMLQQNIPDIKWHLDKDLLVKSNTEYSPDRCIFLPPEINVFFTKRKSCRGDLPIGVQYREKTGKYLAAFTRGSKSFHVGCFSTKEAAFLGYKKAKEAYAKELAEKWKDKIDPRAYEALINYTIEITD